MITDNFKYKWYNKQQQNLTLFSWNLKEKLKISRANLTLSLTYIGQQLHIVHIYKTILIQGLGKSVFMHIWITGFRRQWNLSEPVKGTSLNYCIVYIDDICRVDLQCETQHWFRDKRTSVKSTSLAKKCYFSLFSQHSSKRFANSCYLIALTAFNPLLINQVFQC